MQATLQYLKYSKKQRAYSYFIFLNSSVRGPFYPSYMPRGWHWPDAYLDRFSADVRMVASSIACLPRMDAGGHGPKVSPTAPSLSAQHHVASQASMATRLSGGTACLQVESWAFAVDLQALALLVKKGVFWLRRCKLCDRQEGVVVHSEYAMSNIILEAGFTLATLLSR